MKILNRLQKQLKLSIMAILVLSVWSCDPTIESLAYELPDASSKPDLTPPSASFSASVTADYLTYTFGNTSSSATDYVWDYGDGNTSTDVDGENTFPAEGIYTVKLSATDKLGVTSTFTMDVEVLEPEAPAAITPIIVNADFDKQAKSSGSDCACSGWINKSIGDQGESSSGNGGSNNVLKFDNNEPDHIYQEFEITPNSDYLITVVTSFKSLTGGSYPSMLELRVLAGSGYVSGYTPTYYDVGADYPQDDFGYTSISQVEDDANNLLVVVQENPNDTGYITYTYGFNSEANDSVALFVRGIGGPATGGGGGDFGYNSGDEEIRIDSVIIEPVE
jgi:hypothetical protein